MIWAAESDPATDPIVYGGRLVALAGPSRCHLLVDDLDEEQLNMVMAMCLCSREVRRCRLPGPFTCEMAARWAGVFLRLRR